MAEDEVSAATDNKAERLTKWQFPEHNLNREVQSPVEGDECVIQEQVNEDAKKLDIPASWQGMIIETDYKKSKRPPAAVEAAVHVDPSLAFSMAIQLLAFLALPRLSQLSFIDDHIHLIFHSSHFALISAHSRP
jgi:hypothetical protein